MLILSIQWNKEAYRTNNSKEYYAYKISTDSLWEISLDLTSSLY